MTELSSANWMLIASESVVSTNESAICLGHTNQAASAKLIGTLAYFRKNATTASTLSSKLNLAITAPTICLANGAGLD